MESFGEKWADLFEYFNGTRTEHMIKNRYKNIVKSLEKKAKGGKLSKNWIARLLNSKKGLKGSKEMISLLKGR